MKRLGSSGSSQCWGFYAKLMSLSIHTRPHHLGQYHRRKTTIFASKIPRETASSVDLRPLSSTRQYYSAYWHRLFFIMIIFFNNECALGTDFEIQSSNIRSLLSLSPFKRRHNTTPFESSSSSAGKEDIVIKTLLKMCLLFYNLESSITRRTLKSTMNGTTTFDVLPCWAVEGQATHGKVALAHGMTKRDILAPSVPPDIHERSCFLVYCCCVEPFERKHTLCRR